MSKVVFMFPGQGAQYIGRAKISMMPVKRVKPYMSLLQK